MPSGGPPPKKKEEKAFDASSKTEKKDFDDLGTSKQSKKAARSGNRFGGLGAALGGIWGGGLGSDDDDDDEKPGGALGRPLSEVTSALTIGGAAAADEPGIGELSPRRKRGGETFGGVTFGGWGEMATGLTADLRQGGELPEGLELVGGEASFEEQEDGSQALVLPEGGYLRISLPHVSPWSLEDDGRFHRWSIMLAVRTSHHPHFTHLRPSHSHLRHPTSYRCASTGCRRRRCSSSTAAGRRRRASSSSTCRCTRTAASAASGRWARRRRRCGRSGGRGSR